jgi:hypothetical protein
MSGGGLPPNPPGVPHGAGPLALAEVSHASLRRIWISDVEVLVRAGRRYPEIARRLGVKPKSLHRVLLRKGRLDLWVAAGGGRQLRHRRPREFVDWVAVERAMGGDRSVALNSAERADAVRRLHGRGLSDPQIAAQLGLDKRVVLRYRQRLDLPAVGRPGRRPRS